MCVGVLSWDFGGREAAPRRVGVRVCRLGVCVCVCVSGGGSRPASPQGARVPGRVCVVRGPASGTPERRGLPASRPEFGSLAVLRFPALNCELKSDIVQSMLAIWVYYAML